MPELRAVRGLARSREMKRQRAEAAGDRLALAGQSGCDVPAQPGGKARALPACDSSANAEEEPPLHAARMPEAQASGALPPPMTAADALAQAQAEGLTLARSDNQSGFRNVSVHPECKARPYAAGLKREGKHIHLGWFATAEEAALHVARTPEGQAAAALPRPMTADEALGQAEAEGLTLVRSDNLSGFRHVGVQPESKARPYAASVRRDGKSVYLGSFATAEEAALHVARTPEAQAAAALPPPMTAAEAVAQAEAEGLTLARSDNQSGFRYVGVQPNDRARPYCARLWRDGKEVFLGYFATAEEAALHVARTPEGQAAAALPPPMTAAEAVAQAEAEGLTLARSDRSDNQSGFRYVVALPASKARPYQASVWRDGKHINLGYFATAEEAALHVARTPEGQAAAALPRPMTAAEALAQAVVEGLTLARSSDSQSGFYLVSVQPGSKARPYAASLKREGKHIHLGWFATAEEAALHVARTPEAQTAAALPRPMTADEALGQAEAEGLTLVRSDNQSGFRNVSVHPECKARPYAASVWRDGKSVYLGWFATAEEAALHVARTPEAQAAAQAAAALPPPMTAAEAVSQAGAEGLTLARSDNLSGFRHVCVHPVRSKARPYMASVWRDGKKAHLGCFATAEEAALHVARTPEGKAAAQAAAALPPPMTAAEAVAQAEAEGLTLARSDNQAGFRNVSVQSERQARPYAAGLKREGKHIHLGCFATAEEAALHVARSPEGQAQAKAEAKAQANAEAKAQAQAKAEAKAQAKQAAKAEAVRAREEQKLLFEQHRQQLEEQRRQMAAHQAQLLRAAAEAQRQRKQGGAPPPAAAASGASPAPAAAAEPATGSTDALVQQVLRRGGCPFRCLGLERGTSQEGVRKRYLALALRLHPDKAEHPQADEAFAALEGAYSRARDAAAAAEAAG